MPILLLTSGIAVAQTNVQISGGVTDAESNLPLTGAHAFLGSTMIGAVTDTDGRFELNGVPRGTHMLWISMIGYEPASQELVISDTSRYALSIQLEPAIIPVGELTVTARRDRRWKKRLGQFEKMFLGETDFAQETAILNPEVLDFDANWLSKFTAKAQKPLIIENRALGYRIQYVLKEFSREGSTLRYDGDPLFEELAPASAEEEEIWRQHRERAFRGSFRHFLLSLLADNTEEEGFMIRRLPSVDDIPRTDRRFRIKPRELLEPAEQPENWLLSFLGVIEITYLEEEETEGYLRWKGSVPGYRAASQRSWIRLTNGPTLIDPSGEIVDPYGVTVYGYYAYERLAHDLPKEYLLSDDAAISTQQRP